MGGVSSRAMNCSHLFSSAVPLIDISLKSYFEALSQAAFCSIFVVQLVRVSALAK